MSLTLVATAGASDANSYLTVAEAQAYFDSRTEVAEWDDADSQAALLVMATRVMESLFSPLRKLVRADPPYYLIRPTWTGAPATTTQRLSWPRIGMYNRIGVAIASNAVPQELKEATAELAGQLAKADRLSDNDAAVQGITAVRAGSVSVSFKDAIDATKVIPDIVWDMLIPSWLTDEIIEQALQAQFDVVSE